MSNSSQKPLAGQVAVITGAGRGIGTAIARKLAELGAVAVLCGRSRTLLEVTSQFIQKAGGQAEVVHCDVMDLVSVEAVAGHVERTFASLDVLITNAAVGGFGGPWHRLRPGHWVLVLNTNLTGVNS